jgi:GntR family transcriptional repressor for pyruvate dehydrogenase complex
MPDKSGNLSQRTAAQLEELIVEKAEFRPGQKIPNETELSDHFGVSRATLREAVKILAARGILEVRRGTGTFVSDILPSKSSIDMPDLTRIVTEAHDLYEVRLLFEPQVAALACRNATDAEIDHLQELCDEMDRLHAAGEDTTEADIAFHSSLMTASHNAFIRQLLPVIKRSISDRRLLDAQSRMTASYMPDHRAILKLMRDRDAESVKSAMYIHISELMKKFDNLHKG